MGTHERAQAEMLRDNYANESEQWHEKYDEELAQRKDLEADLNQMRKDCDDATLVRVDLERKIETMVEEMEFLKKIHADEIRELKDQLREYRKTVQTLHMEIDSLRSANDSLNRNMGDLEGRSRREAEGFEDTIRALQNEIEDLKAQMANHLRSYQELMNVKAALDLEINTYRNLLEGEEQRLDNSGM